MKNPYIFTLFWVYVSFWLNSTSTTLAHLVGRGFSVRFFTWNKKPLVAAMHWKSYTRWAFWRFQERCSKGFGSYWHEEYFRMLQHEHMKINNYPILSFFWSSVSNRLNFAWSFLFQLNDAFKIKLMAKSMLRHARKISCLFGSLRSVEDSAPLNLNLYIHIYTSRQLVVWRYVTLPFGNVFFTDHYSFWWCFGGVLSLLKSIPIWNQPGSV